MNNNQLELHVNTIVGKLDEAQRAYETGRAEIRAEFDAFKASIPALIDAAVKKAVAGISAAGIAAATPAPAPAAAKHFSDSQEFGDGLGGSITVPVIARKPKAK